MADFDSLRIKLKDMDSTAWKSAMDRARDAIDGKNPVTGKKFAAYSAMSITGKSPEAEIFMLQELHEKTPFSQDELNVLAQEAKKHNLTFSPEGRLNMNSIAAPELEEAAKVGDVHFDKAEVTNAGETIAKGATEEVKHAAETHVHSSSCSHGAVKAAEKEGSWIMRNKGLSAVLAGVGVIAVGTWISRANRQKQEKAQAAEAGTEMAR